MVLDQWEYVTVEQCVSCTDNQHPGPYIRRLFDSWQNEGWIVQSVSAFPAQSSVYMCRAVGVLKRTRAEKETRAAAETSKPLVPKGHFWRGDEEAAHCQNCGRSYFAHQINDDSTLCPTPSEPDGAP